MTRAQREDLPLEALVEDYMVYMEEEDPHLFKALGRLDKIGQRELAGILGRFDRKNKGKLDAHQRLLTGRVLSRLRKPTTETLSLTNKILDYLDLNTDSLIDEQELDLCIEIFELFAHADSDNDTLSEIELEMLYAVLRHIDTNDNRLLDPIERKILRKELNNPQAFLSNQRSSNPLLRDVLSK